MPFQKKHLPFRTNGFLVVRNVFPRCLMEEISSSLKGVEESDWHKKYGGNTAFMKKEDIFDSPLYGL